jgi:hypothetical protein
MAENERAFLRRRVQEEGDAAARASDPCAASTHSAMQAEYTRRFASLPAEPITTPGVAVKD